MIEYAVYGAPGELPALPDLRAAAGGALVDVSTREIADDWADRWRSFHRPLVIGDRLTVRPPWEPPGADRRSTSWIDPGQAFGTGAHATTRLCLELMLDLDRRRRRALRRPRLRLGRAGHRRRPARLRARDRRWTTTAPPSRRRARTPRATASSSTCAMSTSRASRPRCGFRGGERARRPAVTWAASRQRELPPTLILSGLLASEADGVAEAYARRGHAERERRLSGEWAALLLAAA